MKLLLAILIWLVPFLGAGQMITPQVTNNAGFDLMGNNLVVSISVGEPAIATFSNNQFILTQGFLQPEIIPCGEYQLDYYPNPTQDDMYIEVLGCDIKIESMQLIDIWGRVITTMKANKDNKISLGDISPGVYFIRIFMINHESETIKIAKISN